MIFRQLFDHTSSTYTYVVASRKGGEALVIDPVLENVERYIKLMEELDLKLVKVIDTHIHADHISGMAELRDRTNCITIMGDATPGDVVSMQVKDNDDVSIEGIKLKNILTSDGVSNWADEEHIKMAIQSKHLSFSRKLCSIAKKSGSNDDLSAVVIKTKSSQT